MNTFIPTLAGIISLDNSTTGSLTATGSWSGSFEDVSKFTSVVISCKSDLSGSLFVDFSTDASNVDSTLRYDIDSNLNEVHRLTISKKYYRARYFNAATSSQSYLRLQSLLGNHALLSSPMNLTISQDADAIVTRHLESEIEIANGKYSGYSLVNKFGRNSDIDTATVPEDVWNGGGVYTGFPTGSAEEFEVLSSSTSDTGTITFSYLEHSGSTAYKSATVQMNGTTPVSTGITGIRIHTAQYASGNGHSFNVGTITIRHKITTANVFCSMSIGRSQTNVCAYTIPAGHTGFIKRIFSRVIGSTSGTVGGALWVRTLNGSPRLRRPFTATLSEMFEEKPYGGLSIPEMSDIAIRIDSATANNLDVIAGFDLLLIKNG